jgi:hypothetical protein
VFLQGLSAQADTNGWQPAPVTGRGPAPSIEPDTLRGAYRGGLGLGDVAATSSTPSDGPGGHEDPAGEVQFESQAHE